MSPGRGDRLLGPWRRLHPGGVSPLPGLDDAKCRFPAADAAGYNSYRPPGVKSPRASLPKIWVMINADGADYKSSAGALDSRREKLIFALSPVKGACEIRNTLAGEAGVAVTTETAQAMGGHCMKPFDPAGPFSWRGTFAERCGTLREHSGNKTAPRENYTALNGTLRHIPPLRAAHSFLP